MTVFSRAAPARSEGFNISFALTPVASSIKESGEPPMMPLGADPPRGLSEQSVRRGITQPQLWP
jgi:hypothetical protein